MEHLTRKVGNRIEVGVELETGFVHFDKETGERSSYKGPVWMRIPVIGDELEAEAKLRLAQIDAGDNRKEAARTRTEVYRLAMFVLEVITEWEGLGKPTVDHLVSLRTKDWNRLASLHADADKIAAKLEDEGNE